MDRLKAINLGKGFITFVDIEDYDWLMQWKWRPIKAWKSTYYAMRYETIDGKRVSILMHRAIVEHVMGIALTFAQKVDHWNQDSLDNRYANLRIATNSENGRNRGKQVDNTSGYKGVTLDKRYGTFFARIKLHGKQIHLGTYKTAIEAAQAYDRAALLYHGDFARLNFPDEAFK